MKTLIHIDSHALGDNLAWIPYVEEYRLHNELETLDCYCIHHKIFKNKYPQINFVETPHFQKYNQSRVIGLRNPDDKNFHESDWRHLNLQAVACELLKIPYKEVKPKINYDFQFVNQFKSKYVCISTHSTALAKYWNYPRGWDDIVDYLKEKGFEVVCIDKYQVFGIENAWSSIPRNVIDKTGNKSLKDRINDLYFCSFYIGLSSGLSWLAWAMEKPVLMISGFTLPYTEFYTPYRPQNTSVCHGCWNNENYQFDRSDWHWCPKHKGTKRAFECSKNITPEMVIRSINQLMEEHTIL